MSSSFTGILPAVVTTIDDEERFNAAPFERLLDSFYRQGCHGVYVCGQTGEGLLQSAAQRKKVAEVAVHASPKGKIVIIHVGAQSTRETVDLARHAASIGAAAVSSLPPSGRYSFAEVKAFYTELAFAAGIPVFVYYFPDMYPQVSGFDQLFQLLEIPNVAGVKFTNFNLYELLLCASAGKTVFNGHDEVMTAGLLMGARGGIGTFYNLVPDLLVRIWNLTREGKWEEAISVQTRLNNLIHLVLSYPMMPAIKEILNWRGIAAGPCIAPRRNLTPEQKAALRSGLASAGFSELLATPIAP
ncbi:MAG TPA: dihydrodipicolinate synthase family protein [Bryobacteraceae bacterium]|jgi:N-acetylneuraminate lyase